MKMITILLLLLTSFAHANESQSRTLEASEMWFRKRLSLTFEVPAISSLRVRPSVEIRTKLKKESKSNQSEIRIGDEELTLK